MTENQPTRTSRAANDEQAQTEVPSNRRQFLKLTVFNGIIGLIDGSLMNRSASASSLPHSSSTGTLPSNDDHLRQDKILYVTGIGENNNYTIVIEEIKNSRGNNDAGSTIDETVIEGHVREDTTDIYQIQGDMTAVYTQGAITYTIE